MLQINEYLQNYSESDIYPWHMPGHKRQAVFGDDFLDSIHRRDFTEAAGLDDMHQPEDFIAEALAKLKDIYGSHATYMLVNGSTGGILSAVYACVPEGGRVLVARNCHKAVYNAISLLGAAADYIIPEFIPHTNVYAGVTASQVDERLTALAEAGKTPHAVIITSPTYEGVISDVASIANVCHAHGVRLIVDEAHGAYLSFTMPQLSAVNAGADVVVQSTHKTLPALTQTGLLHVNDATIDKKLRKYMQIFQTSSPSYVFMQSIEKAVAYMSENAGAVDAYKTRISDFRKRCAGLKSIKLLEDDTFAYDEGKLVLMLPGQGPWLATHMYEEFRLAVEMASRDYVILMTSVADSQSAFDRLYSALEALDDKAQQETVADDACATFAQGAAQPEKRLTAGQAMNCTTRRISLQEACGRVAAEYVCAYPPGVPVIVPGEAYDAAVVEDILAMLAAGLKVVGVEEGEVEVIQ